MLVVGELVGLEVVGVEPEDGSLGVLVLVGWVGVVAGAGVSFLAPLPGDG